MIHLELSELGLPTDRPLNVRDELTGREFQWVGTTTCLWRLGRMWLTSCPCSDAVVQR